MYELEIRTIMYVATNWRNNISLQVASVTTTSMVQGTVILPCGKPLECAIFDSSTTVERRDIAKSIHNDKVTWYKLPLNGCTMYSSFGIVNTEDEKPMYMTS